MPFVLMIMGLLGGLQIYFYNISDRAQKSVAAQILLSRSQKNINDEVFLEQLLTIQVQELMRRNGVTALDLEKGLSESLNASNPENPEADRSSPLFRPGPTARLAAQELLKFQKLTLGNFNYQIKAIASSLPRDPTGYVDLAVCPVDGVAEDRRKPKRLRMRLSVKSGFLNALAGNQLEHLLHGAEIYGHVAESGYHDPLSEQPQYTPRIYGSFFNGGDFNADMSGQNDGYPFNFETGDESGYIDGTWDVPFEPARRQYQVMGDTMFTDARTKPSTFDGTTINKQRTLPWQGWRNFGFVKKTEPRYDGPELSWNPQTRSKSLPKFNPDMVRILARGTLTAQGQASLTLVPYAQDWGARQKLDKIEPDPDTGLAAVDGNLIIDGRNEAFNICGRIFASGDIVVMGKYTSKHADGSVCQSSLISGRNIYVTDNLEAVNPAPEFDKRVPANVDVLARISEPAQARSLAERTWNSDNLALIAANNVVMGNPFPFEGKPKVVNGRTFLEPAIGSDLSTVISDGLAKYQEELYYHRETGVMAMPNIINDYASSIVTTTTDADGNTVTTTIPGKIVCYTLPWENVESTCRTRDVSNNLESNKRFVKVPMFEPAFMDNVKDQLATYHILYGWYLPEGYWKLFLPINVVNRTTGELKPWINETDFRNLVRTQADKDKFVKPDACGRTGVVLTSQLPYRDPAVLKPGLDLGGFVQDMDSAQLIAETDRLTGFLTTYGDYPVEYKELGWLDQKDQQYTVREMFERQVRLCMDGRMKMNPGYRFASKFLPAGDELPNQAPLGEFQGDNVRCMDPKLIETAREPQMMVERETRVTGYNWSTNRTMSATDRDYFFGDYFSLIPKKQDLGWASVSMGCYINFYVAQKTPDCDGGKPKSFIMSSGMNQWEYPGWGPSNSATFCHPQPDLTGIHGYACNRTLQRTELRRCSGCMASGTFDASKCTDTGTYYYHWISADTGISPLDYRMSSPDFKFELSSANWWRPSMYVHSRFLTGQTESGVARSEALQNRVKKVDAFVMANQFAAITSETGYDRTLELNGGIASRDILGRPTSRIGPFRPGFNPADPTAAYRSKLGGGEEPGMIVTWDPRYRYSEDIIQADVGSSEMAEGAEEATAACASAPSTKKGG